MAADPKRKALADAQRAQAKYEKTQAQIDKDAQMRRESFTRAKEAGATLREIGEAVGLHFTRVARVLRDKP
jgi:hypothetical protein